jgi:hypothetical protein
MAKFRPAGSRKATARKSNRGIIPCVFLLLGGFALIFLLFYAMLKSGK